MGNIGQSLAIKANCFGFNVISYTSNPKKKKNFCHKNKVKLVSIKSLLMNSDFVSLNLPLTEKTKGFIDFDKLSLMKPTAWFINTSRGSIINEDALLKAVEKKIIAGAALDVFCNEPKPRKELLKKK